MLLLSLTPMISPTTLLKRLLGSNFFRTTLNRSRCYFCQGYELAFLSYGEMMDGVEGNERVVRLAYVWI